MSKRLKKPKTNMKFRLFKMPEMKTKKKRLLVLLILFLIFIVLAGIGISRVLLKEKDPDKKTTENVQTEQSQETEKEKEKETEKEKEKETEKEKKLDTGNLENHLASDFIKTLKSGEYMIRYKTTTVYNDQSFAVETTYAVSHGNIVLVSGDRATIVKDNRVYMLNHTDKTMLSWNVDHSSGDLKRIDTEGITYIGSASENGLDCEEYKTVSSNLKLYFKEKTLVKIVTLLNGQDTTMDIIEVSKEAPESIFQVPQGYESEEL